MCSSDKKISRFGASTKRLRILFLGSGGRLGRLLRNAANFVLPNEFEARFQSRQKNADIFWSPHEPATCLPDADIVVGLWGVTKGDDVALAQNSVLSSMTTQVANAVGAMVAVHVSSAAVYGPGQEIAEDRPPAPSNAYGRAKLEMEQSVIANLNTGALEHRILRLANVVGADSLAPALKTESPATLDRFESGEGPQRSYLTAQDFLRVVCALSSSLRKPSGSDLNDWPVVLNVAAPRPVDMADLLHACGKEIRWRPAPAEAVQHVSLSTKRLVKTLPELTLTQAPEDMISEWHTIEDRE